MCTASEQLTGTPIVAVLTVFSLIVTLLVCMLNLVQLQPFPVTANNNDTYEHKAGSFYSTQLHWWSKLLG